MYIYIYRHTHTYMHTHIMWYLSPIFIEIIKCLKIVEL